MEDEKKLEKKKKIFICVGVVILIALIICFGIAFKNTKTATTQNNLASSDAESASDISSEYSNINYGSSVALEGTTITKGGTYELSGSYGLITINTEDAVELVLTDVQITAENGPAIYVENAKTVSIVLNGTNTITATTTEDLDGAIYSKDDLVFSGTGTLEVKSNYDGIVSKDSLVINSGTFVINTDDEGIRGKDNVAIVDGNFTITSGGSAIKSTNDTEEGKGYIAIDGGTFNINAATDGIHAEGNVTINGGDFTIEAKDDGIHAVGLLEINGGTFNITAVEGLEATYVRINDGTLNITASDDGINAANKSTAYSTTVEINGGNITISMGQGDTDGIDSNGNLYINGGTLNITGQSPFDYDGEAVYNGGTMIVNGEETTTITNQFAGGMGGGMMQGGRGNKGDMNGERPEMDGNFTPENFTEGEMPTPPDGNFEPNGDMSNGQRSEKPQGGQGRRGNMQNGQTNAQ